MLPMDLKGKVNVIKSSMQKKETSDNSDLHHKISQKQNGMTRNRKIALLYQTIVHVLTNIIVMIKVGHKVKKYIS